MSPVFRALSASSHRDVEMLSGDPEAGQGVGEQTCSRETPRVWGYDPKGLRPGSTDKPKIVPPSRGLKPSSVSC